MKVTYDWLKDFVEIKVAPEQLAELLTMAGLEVVSLERRGQDALLEIEITSNRPDWLSVIGVAREVGAVTGKKLNVQSLMFNVKNIKHSTLNKKQIAINIESKQDCPLYTAKIIRDVKVGPSPEWLKNRLEAVGCRSVNNIVDITNYVLFEYGEPLHAFDLDKIVRKFVSSQANLLEIVIRRAHKAEEITTIDGQRRFLDEGMLVIASSGNLRTKEPANLRTNLPIAIAGIMGGKDTEVTGETKNILLEAAVFNPALIRKARQKLGLQTDSSYRFERGVDGSNAEPASQRAAVLIQELCAGSIQYSAKAGAVPGRAKKIILTPAAVKRVLGAAISEVKIKHILSSLGFTVAKKSKGILTAGVPAHRADVRAEIDLIEELARISGYENIPATLPKSAPRIIKQFDQQAGRRLKDLLTGMGLCEANTYSLIHRGMLWGLDFPEEKLVEIANPLSQDQGVLRPALIPGLLRCVAVNLNQKQEAVELFEIARAFSREGPRIEEKPMLGIVLCGAKSFFTSQGMRKDTLGLLHLKGIIEQLCLKLGIENYSFKTATPGVEFYLGEEKAGVMAAQLPGVLERFGIKNKDVVSGELDMDKLLKAVSARRFQKLAQYPELVRDISLVVKEEASAQGLLEAVRRSSGELLKEVKIIDYYRGNQVPAGHKSLTISCVYRSDSRTLTEEEINPLHSALARQLSASFNAAVR